MIWPVSFFMSITVSAKEFWVQLSVVALKFEWLAARCSMTPVSPLGGSEHWVGSANANQPSGCTCLRSISFFKMVLYNKSSCVTVFQSSKVTTRMHSVCQSQYFIPILFIRLVKALNQKTNMYLYQSSSSKARPCESWWNEEKLCVNTTIIYFILKQHNKLWFPENSTG